MTETRSEGPLSIGFVSVGDARDPRTWSGTTYHLAQALEQAGNRLSYMSPLRTGSLWEETVAARIRRRLKRPHPAPELQPGTAQRLARQITRAVAQTRPDILFAPVGSVPLSALKTDLPLAYTSDATSALLRDYYPRYADRGAEIVARAEAAEEAVIARADLLLYPSAWAARSAVADYGADPAKVHVVPYGANMDAPDRDTALAPRAEGPLRLLFIGTDWVRKGGAITVAALDALQARGIDATLTVIGTTPPPEAMRDSITVIRFIDKTDPAQRDRLGQELLAADFLILPTRQECYGIVFCEAAAHGVPSVTNATGGVPDVVHQGVTGALLPPEADGAGYADQIEAMLNGPGGLMAARTRARDDYEARLNWTSWAERAQRLMRDVTGKG